jgi:hypothetical protein
MLADGLAVQIDLHPEEAYKLRIKAAMKAWTGW